MLKLTNKSLRKVVIHSIHPPVVGMLQKLSPVVFLFFPLAEHLFSPL
jgi:hypothetical protein